jgi:hypothetical protein
VHVRGAADRRTGASLGAVPALLPRRQRYGQVPLTPGGLGVVEAGLTGTLALIGVNGGAAVLATLAYGLFNYGMYLPAGLIGLLLPGAPPTRRNPPDPSDRACTCRTE